MTIVYQNWADLNTVGAQSTATSLDKICSKIKCCMAIELQGTVSEYITSLRLNDVYVRQ